MFPPDQYQIVDFGEGRRLERFGPLLIDRPCPAVEGVKRAKPDLWPQADARFDRGEGETGRWVCRGQLPERWAVGRDHAPARCPAAHGARLRFELRRTETGQVGLFPEQADNWDWILQQVRRANGPQAAPLSVLNLFAYTGGSTLAAAAAGAAVTHVDGAKNVVAWARRNAELSGLAGAPVHWIAEDAVKYVKRELRRGRGYDAVILDPPSYGHGPRGEVWRLARDLPRLLALCRELTAGRRRFMLLTCHTPGFEPQRLQDMMAAALDPGDRGRIWAASMTLRTAGGRELPSGAVVRWERICDL